MVPPSENPRERRLLHVDDQQIQSVVHELDSSSRDRAVSRRSQRRFRYRHADCAVRVRQPGDAEAKWFRMATRNLSAGGIALLHGGFVHAKSEVMLRLPAVHNQLVDVMGIVRACRYLRIGVYEVSVQFHAPIHPETFCREAQACRVLLVESDPLIAELTQRQMRALHAVVSTVATVELAVRKLLDERFDCVLLNGDAPLERLIGQLVELNTAGHFGRIVATVSGQDAERDAALTKAGFDRVVVGPLDSSAVSQLLSWLPGEPLVSSFNADPMVRDLLLSFVEQLADRMRGLHTMLNDNRMEDFVQALRALRSAAGGFGYEPLAAEAEQLERAAVNAPDLDQLQASLRNLIRMAGNVRSPEQSRGSAA